MSSNSTYQLQSSQRESIHLHLIERCLLWYMDRNECVACLQKYANLKPAITRIVWDELEKSNVEFFAAYAARRMELQVGGGHEGPHFLHSSFLNCHVQDTENQQLHNTPRL